MLIFNVYSYTTPLSDSITGNSSIAWSKNLLLFETWLYQFWVVGTLTCKLLILFLWTQPLSMIHNFDQRASGMWLLCTDPMCIENITSKRQQNLYFYINILRRANFSFSIYKKAQNWLTLLFDFFFIYYNSHTKNRK